MKEQPFHVLDEEADLEEEEVRDSAGRRVDAAYVERAVADVHARPGRPSLSEEPRHSPQVSFRVPEQTRRLLDERANAEGRTPSEIAREALIQYLESTNS
ncbi:hypothetical protein GCM10023321_36650 [Pseudonocardia eucalypti]|uniref:Ribbon-helix-helix protein CopG domain-containing protein n=1 Tax=Pseudonocardia eucalypti TaxID=648755 RepID=A0ABP9Q7T4_9PSEU|nr:hypothetical protein [Pseudonocardia eucalypti]